MAHIATSEQFLRPQLRSALRRFYGALARAEVAFELCHTPADDVVVLGAVDDKDAMRFVRTSSASFDAANLEDGRHVGLCFPEGANAATQTDVETAVVAYVGSNPDRRLDVFIGGRPSVTTVSTIASRIDKQLRAYPAAENMPWECHVCVRTQQDRQAVAHLPIKCAMTVYVVVEEDVAKTKKRKKANTSRSQRSSAFRRTLGVTTGAFALLGAYYVAFRSGIAQDASAPNALAPTLPEFGAGSESEVYQCAFDACDTSPASYGDLKTDVATTVKTAFASGATALNNAVGDRDILKAATDAYTQSRAYIDDFVVNAEAMAKVQVEPLANGAAAVSGFMTSQMPAFTLTLTRDAIAHEAALAATAAAGTFSNTAAYFSSLVGNVTDFSININETATNLERVQTWIKEAASAGAETVDGDEFQQFMHERAVSFFSSVTLDELGQEAVADVCINRTNPLGSGRLFGNTLLTIPAIAEDVAQRFLEPLKTMAFAVDREAAAACFAVPSSGVIGSTVNAVSDAAASLKSYFSAGADAIPIKPESVKQLNQTAAALVDVCLEVDAAAYNGTDGGQSIWSVAYTSEDESVSAQRILATDWVAQTKALVKATNTDVRAGLVHFGNFVENEFGAMHTESSASVAAAWNIVANKLNLGGVDADVVESINEAFASDASNQKKRQELAHLAAPDETESLDELVRNETAELKCYGDRLDAIKLPSDASPSAETDAMRLRDGTAALKRNYVAQRSNQTEQLIERLTDNASHTGLDAPRSANETEYEKTLLAFDDPRVPPTFGNLAAHDALSMYADGVRTAFN